MVALHGLRHLLPRRLLPFWLANLRWSHSFSAGCYPLKQGVSAIVKISDGIGGNLQSLYPPLLGLRYIAVECNGRRGKVASLSVLLNDIKRGISSSTLVSSPSPSGDCSGSSENEGDNKNNGRTETLDPLTFSEAKKLMRLVDVESLKKRLGSEGKEVIPYSELLQTCQSMGVAKNPEEAMAFARVLDEAGVVLLFRDKVHLHPDKVVDMVKRAVPLELTAEDDPLREELKKMLERKEEIDALAHKQVRRVLWSGLGFGISLTGLFFRLTFWEFSWDVMEPIAFFTTSTGLVIGYAYFLFTSRDPTYRDFMKRLFISKQRKLFKRQNFDVERFKELQIRCRTPLDASNSLKNRVDLEDALK